MAPSSSAEHDEKGHPDIPDYKIDQYAKEYYEKYTRKATEDLTTFTSSLTPENPVVVTYFDEVHELKLSYWMLLHLLNVQDRKIPMWAVFMGTQSSIIYLSPAPKDSECPDLTQPTISQTFIVLSLRLRMELECLLEPYLALGFDQNMICEKRPLVTVTMGYLQSIEHLSRYGRPMYINSCTVGDVAEVFILGGIPYFIRAKKTC